jgi:hypothetical protein
MKREGKLPSIFARANKERLIDNQVNDDDTTS